MGEGVRVGLLRCCVDGDGGHAVEIWISGLDGGGKGCT